MANKFRVGDRVTIKPNGPYTWPDAKTVAGFTGIITLAEPVAPRVTFDKWHHGHGANDSSWYVHQDDILGLADTGLQQSSPAILPADAAERKKVPLGTGVLDYFPAALAEVAKISYAGNQQHNPGEPLHWARGKSTDQADTMLRHFLERGTLDSDGQRHSAKMCWRALAILQLELEAEGAPVARGAKS